MKRTILLLTSSVALLAAGCAPHRGGDVAMLTDYGTRDHYVGVLCADVLRSNPGARIIPISHEIEPFNIVQGAFVLAEAAPAFPPGTVFLGVVDPGVGTARFPIVAVTNAGHILVGPDNGLFDLLLQAEGLREMYIIENLDLIGRAGGEDSRNRDIFAPVAGHLSRGVPPRRFGAPLSSWIRLDVAPVELRDDACTGSVLHADRFGNLLTNINGSWLKRFPLGTRFDLRAAGALPIVATRGRTYGDVPTGEFVILENASSHIEVARNKGSAAAATGLKAGSRIEIRALPAAP